MRNTKLKHAIANENIDTLVTLIVKSFLRSIIYENPDQNSLLLSLNQIHVYLDSHSNLLPKMLICFSHNETEEHWWGWVAANPPYHVLKIPQK